MAVQLNIPQNISAAEWDLEDETDGESLATTMFEHIQNRTLNIQQCAQIVLHLFQSESHEIWASDFMGGFYREFIKLDSASESQHSTSVMLAVFSGITNQQSIQLLAHLTGCLSLSSTIMSLSHMLKSLHPNWQISDVVIFLVSSDGWSEGDNDRNHARFLLLALLVTEALNDGTRLPINLRQQIFTALQAQRWQPANIFFNLL